MDEHAHTMAEFQKIAKAKDVFDDDPDLFLRRASGTNGTPADPYYLHALSCHMDLDQDHRTVQYLQTLLKMLLEGYLRTEVDPLDHLMPHTHGPLPKSIDWDMPFGAIVRMMVNMHEDGGGPQDDALVEVLYEHWERIMMFLSKDLSVYIDNDSRTNRRQHSVFVFCSLMALWRGVAPCVCFQPPSYLDSLSFRFQRYQKDAEVPGSDFDVLGQDTPAFTSGGPHFDHNTVRCER